MGGMSRPNTKRKAPMTTKVDVQPWWDLIRHIADKSVERIGWTFEGVRKEATYCGEPEYLIQFAHSLAVSNAYQAYKEALGEPANDDVDMQHCRLVRHRIVHDFELISQQERDRCLDIIASRLKSAGLID